MACGAGEAGPTPRPDPTGSLIRFGYPAEPATLDPLGPGGDGAATRDVLQPVLPSLFRLDEELRPQPDLVEAWPEAADYAFDPFSVTLRLREATWSDGRPIGAEDVRFSFERLREGPTSYRYRFLEEVEVLGPAALRLNFDRPMRRWWSLFSLDDMVLPEHAYDPETWGDGPTVSGGPYRFDGWTRGLEVRLRRNDVYWGPPAILAGIDVQFVPDDETRFQLVDGGDLDGFFSEGDSNLGRRAEARGLEPTGAALDERGGASGAWGPTWWELDLDPSRIGEDVARAVVQALDPALVDEMMEDSARGLDAIPARFPLGEGADEPWSGRGSLDEARETLGGGSGATFQLAYPRKGAAGAIGRLVHFRLLEIGVRVELAGLQPEHFDVSVGPAVQGSERAPAVLRLRRGADAPDAGLYGDGENVELSESAVSLDRLAEGPVVGLAPEAWLRVQVELADGASVAPLAQVRTWLVGREGLGGPRATGTSEGPLWNVHDWWVVL